jgi:hypothetical protein
MKYIHLPVFLLSFLIGIIYIYLSNEATRDIYVYPTIDNQDMFQYIDKAENCFSFVPKEVKCPINTGSLKSIPIQV